MSLGSKQRLALTHRLRERFSQTHSVTGAISLGGRSTTVSTAS